MNFDVNTLSALMQMMSAMKPRADEAPKPQDNSSASKSRENPSVFAMQNGLGETVEIGGKKSEKQNSQSQSNVMGNPMAAMLEMLTGSKSQNNGGDMLSSLMPMLMNMMGGRQAQAQSTQNAQNSNHNYSSGKTGYNQNSNGNSADNQSANTINAQNSNPFNAQDSNVENRNNKTENNCKMKTQPTQDKYEPIAFAGYTLISALNKLYIAKRE